MTSNAAEVEYVQVIETGLLAYPEAIALQEKLVDERVRALRGDTLLIVEHEPVITLGRGAHRDNVRFEPDALARMGVALCESTRGGDVTLHSPGQLVAYPIVALPPARRDVRQYVWSLEEALIRTVAHFGIQAERVDGSRGVFVGNDKIAAIGVRISRWVTSHGVALNVCNDLSLFDAIVPCGLADRGVTSLSKLLGREVPVAEVKPILVEALTAVIV
jgi:lipoate-protein ligase B